MNIKIENNHWKFLGVIAAVVGLGFGLGLGGAALWQFNNNSRDVAELAKEEPALPVLPTVPELYPQILPPNSTLNAALRALDI
ncbi:MAG: hypothetical protein EOP06_10470, partial [Proteobacteria bacterium]